MNKRTFLKFFALASGGAILAPNTTFASDAHHAAPNTGELLEMA